MTISDLSDQQRVLFGTGSFTGYRPLQALGSHYLDASKRFSQPLCANEEGWGPFSPHRYDFTPCFIDVWVATVATFGLVAGSGVIWWLVRRKQSTDTHKGWHFWTKQVRSHSPERRRRYGPVYVVLLDLLH
jgi:ATP-binding cassette subfamily C (CFTR/MRP) protein 1